MYSAGLCVAHLPVALFAAYKTKSEGGCRRDHFEFDLAAEATRSCIYSQVSRAED